MSEYSQSRIESRILEAVNTLIVSGDIKNPKLSRFASISAITLSRDNAYATLYVSCLMDDGSLENSVKALQSAAGFIQGRLAQALKTRNTPKLTFVADTTEREAQKMNELLEKLK
jgi:ribosome-binding factor A